MILYPKHYATCAGSKRAIELAYELKNKFKDKNIFIYKEILHNSYIINKLKNNNIECIDNLDGLTDNDILIIRAHGEAKSTYDYLDSKKICYYDATCKNVLRVHNIVKERQKDFKIVIVGKKNHPEVIGTSGWCNNPILIEDEKDYNFDKKEKYYIVCQTTTDEKKLYNLLNYLDKENIYYEYTDTICKNQKLIQTSSKELAKKVDVMFVIGGKNSSNTKELYKEVSNVNKHSYFFSDIKEFYNFIKKENFTEKTKIGFTAGASTTIEELNEYEQLLKFNIYYKNHLKILKKEINKYNKLFIKNDNSIVNDAINKLIYMNQDGKFIRGTLINLGYNLKSNDSYSIPLEIAYETFETSILIHDDIIDNAKTRRGKKTIPELYKDDFKELNTNNQNIYNSLGICIGDLGFYLTNYILLKKYKNDKNIVKLLDYYNNVVINTIKGEIIDVTLPFLEEYDKNHILLEKDIMEIYKLKTSYYTIVGPFCLGCILANKNNIKEIESSLIPLGIAFQIKDDILGIFSNAKTIGKSNTSDIEEFKQTILYSYIKINKKEYLNELLNYYGKRDITESELLKVQNILIESGSLEYATNTMNILFNEARNNINNLNINKKVKDLLLGLTIYLELREK